MRDRVEHPGGPGVQRRGWVAELVQRGALAVAQVPVAGTQPPDGRAGGSGVGVDADPRVGQVFGEGGQRGVQPLQGPAQRVSQRGIIRRRPRAGYLELTDDARFSLAPEPADPDGPLSL